MRKKKCNVPRPAVQVVDGEPHKDWEAAVVDLAASGAWRKKQGKVPGLLVTDKRTGATAAFAFSPTDQVLEY